MINEDRFMPQPVTEALDDLKDKIRFVEGLIPHVNVAARALSEYGPGHEKDEIRIGYIFGSLCGVLIHTHVGDLKEVLPLIRELRRQGYKILKHDDYAEVRRRSYYMGEIIVSAFLRDEKGKGRCRYVKTGTKHEDVYTLECDGVRVEDPNLVIVDDSNLVADA